MGRNKKRQSRVGSKDEKPSRAKETLISDDNQPSELEVNKIRNYDSNEKLHSDPEAEEFEQKVPVSPLREDGDADDYVDVLGNGLLLKKVLDKGIGFETRPGHSDVVTISYKGWLEDGTLVEDVASKTLTLGDGDVLQALELALPLAELEERFELISDSRFTYGSLGREPDIPGESKIRYEVQVLSARDPPCYATMPNNERVTIADEKRERGNYYYRRREYAFAVNSYNKALKILTAPHDDPQGRSNLVLSEEVDMLEIKLQNNLAVTQLQIQAYDAAIKSCDAVLRKDPTNFKALYRKGKALLEQGDADEAISILKKLHDRAPTSPVVASELQRARVLLQRQQERWSKTASTLYPNLVRKKQTKSEMSRMHTTICSARALFFLSILVALAAITFAWYLDRLPLVEPLEKWVQSIRRN